MACATMAPPADAAGAILRAGPAEGSAHHAGRTRPRLVRPRARV